MGTWNPSTDKEEEVMVKRQRRNQTTVFSTTFTRYGAKSPIKIYTQSSDPVNSMTTRFYTKPNSDGRSTEVWDVGAGRKKGTRRYVMVGAGPSPRWLKKFFGRDD